MTEALLLGGAFIVASGLLGAAVAAVKVARVVVDGALLAERERAERAKAAAALREERLAAAEATLTQHGKRIAELTASGIGATRAR